MGENMKGLDSISCSISGDTLLYRSSDLHLLTFYHCLNSTARNHCFSSNNEYTCVKRTLKIMTMIALQPLCISWRLQDHHASFLIVVNNILKVLLYDQNLKISWPSAFRFCAFSCYLCSCFCSTFGLLRDFPWCTDFHVLAISWPSSLLFPDPTIYQGIALSTN